MAQKPSIPKGTRDFGPSEMVKPSRENMSIIWLRTMDMGCLAPTCKGGPGSVRSLDLSKIAITIEELPVVIFHASEAESLVKFHCEE